MLERIQDMPDNIIGIRASGEATRKDYESVVTAAVDEGLKHAPKLSMLVQFAPDFTGFEAGAMVADAKLGLRHPFSWEKVALVTDVDWMRRATNLFGFLMPGEVKVYSNGEFDQAKDWVAA
jgi:SpoIIAA-like